MANALIRPPHFESNIHVQIYHLFSFNYEHQYFRSCSSIYWTFTDHSPHQSALQVSVGDTTLSGSRWFRPCFDDITASFHGEYSDARWDMNDQSYPTGSNLENHRRGFSSSSLDGRPTEEGVDGRNDRVRGGERTSTRSWPAFIACSIQVSSPSLSRGSFACSHLLPSTCSSTVI